MLDKPEIVQTEAQQAAVIRVTVPREQIQDAMGPGYGELMATLEAQGIAPAGTWYTHHLRMDPEVFDFEIGVPVERAIAPAGRVQPGTLPAARVARAVYHGGYEGLGDAWGQFEGWISAEGLSAAPNLWERYVAGPESGPDPAGWRTELNRPLL